MREIAGLQDVLVATGALARTEDTITSLTQQAIEAIDHPAVPSAAVHALTDLARFIACRDA